MSSDIQRRNIVKTVKNFQYPFNFLNVWKVEVYKQGFCFQGQSQLLEHTVE
jgi:hypothetical protein